jgi:GTP:adenosylcobinamide-phosphate guanylyltransferase
MLRHVRDRVDKAVADVNAFIETDWPAFKEFVQGKALPVFRPIGKVE